MATPQHKSPCNGGSDVYNLGRIFLGHHNNTLNLSEPCAGVFFLKNYSFYPVITCPWGGWGY